MSFKRNSYEARKHFMTKYSKEYLLELTEQDILIQHIEHKKIYVDAQFNKDNCYIQMITSDPPGFGIQLVKILREILIFLKFKTLSGHVTHERLLGIFLKLWPEDKIEYYTKSLFDHGHKVDLSRARELIREGSGVVLFAYL